VLYKNRRKAFHAHMLRLYSNLFFSIAIGSTFLLKVTHLPDPLIWFTAACMVVGAALSTLMLIRTTGMALSAGGLILVFRSAPEPSATLAGLLVFLAVLQITATFLLISADLSTVKEKQSLEL
jgi:hypothetical protein